MLGDRRKFPVLLVVPNFQQLEKWAKENQLTWADQEQLVALPAVQAMMEQEVHSQLTGLAHFETPGKIALLAHDFSVDSGELTPTLKVKRRVIDQRYKAMIDALYVGAPSRDS
jgi:long-chain acyl-CoA synthetase